MTSLAAVSRPAPCGDPVRLISSSARACGAGKAAARASSRVISSTMRSPAGATPSASATPRMRAFSESTEGASDTVTTRTPTPARRLSASGGPAGSDARTRSGFKDSTPSTGTAR
ncbi:hypothetical protein G6F57_021224 [Rhizopus arrhizus]|nr:hypothetical protein G6F57_021224 [Rhizopus arrhizus]